MMFWGARLLATVVLAISVTANPIVVRDNLIRVPFAKRINETHVKNVLHRDQFRVAALRARVDARKSGQFARASSHSAPATNQAIDYIASVQVGTQSEPFDLIIDTGSSNTWVGAGQELTSTTATTNEERLEVQYGSGFFVGVLAQDSVSVGSALTVSKQEFGVASESEGFEGVDGILGLGPASLTEGTILRDERATIPTVTDNLFSQGVIPVHEVAISFEPTTEESATNGELTFGGTDSSKFTGAIHFFPKTKTSPSSEFWGLDQSITYGGSGQEILSETAGIVDTGTTLILLATDALANYQQTTGATADETTGLLKLSSSQFSNLQSLFFNIGSTSFELTPNAQAWPRSLNAAIGGDADSVYLIVNDIGTPSGQGLDFVNGQTFLERFYSVFVTHNSTIGLATTSFTKSTSN